MKILHIEDDQLIRAGLMQLLTHLGHEVESRDTVPDADKIVTEGFDWVICDGTISSAHDGADLAAGLHERRQKVVIVSASLQSKRKGVLFIDKMSVNWTSELAKLISDSRIQED